MNSFGSGYLIGRAAATTANPNPTPRKFGQLQEVSVDDSFDEKMLWGTGQRAVRSFRGQAKTALKAKFAQIRGQMFAELFFQATTSVGSTLASFNELYTVPATPFSVTVANAGMAGANFAEDYGVEYALTSAPLTLVAAAPTVGQYAVSAAGVYLFAAADTGAQVVISYSYKNTTTGISYSTPNIAQQEAPYFEVVLINPQDGGLNRKYFKCSASKLSMAFKQGDIMIPELDIAVLDPGTGLVFVDSYASA